MIKWCSYCIHFIGECEPWGDYQISHGVCPACYQRLLTSDVPHPGPVQEFKAFFRSMQRLARLDHPGDVARILAESRRLGIPAMDLMLGILQPLLVEIGLLWAAGRVTVAAEHHFSALVDDLLAHLRPGPDPAAEPGPPRLVLLGAEGNDHVLGLKMAGPYFLAAGVPTLTLLTPLPARELLELLDHHRPAAVGFSIALPEQLAQVQETARRIRRLPAPPRHLLVGGAAARAGLALDPALDLRLCRQLPEALALLR